MGKLTSLPPRVQPLTPRLGVAPGDRRSSDRQRLVMSPWRRWYWTAEWRELRLRVFLRDQFICQRSHVLCDGRHPAPNSPVANHKLPHRGDPTLFWDIDNIETVSKAVHDSLIQSEESEIPTGFYD